MVLPTIPPDSSVRRVLIVAYYFPPMGGSGVQRIAKFAKYLRAHGWHPEVLTVAPRGYLAYDDSLLEEIEAAGIPIHRTSSWDPTRVFGKKRAIGLPGESARNLFAQASQWLFIPDNKRGWRRPAVKTGKRLLASGRFDAILATAPPYTAGLIARDLHQATGIPYLVDFRDDWAGNPRHTYPTSWHKKKHLRMEQAVMRDADGVLTINEQIASAIQFRQGIVPEVIPQGYDPQDLQVAPSRKEANQFRLVYTGMFYDRQRPDSMLAALGSLVKHDPGLRDVLEAVFVGLPPEALKPKAEALGIANLIKGTGYLSHQDAVAYTKSADLLWMTVGEGPGQETISTSKLFEYFGTGLPILGLVPEGAARNALLAYGAGRVALPDHVDEITQALLLFLAEWKAGTPLRADEAFVASHNRYALAGQLAQLLSAL